MINWSNISLITLWWILHLIVFVPLRYLLDLGNWTLRVVLLEFSLGCFWDPLSIWLHFCECGGETGSDGESVLLPDSAVRCIGFFDVWNFKSLCFSIVRRGGFWAARVGWAAFHPGFRSWDRSCWGFWASWTRGQYPNPDYNRTAVLKVIGSWLVHALAGRIVGRSGRERLPESSRVYLILQDSVGNPFNPARVCQSWREAQRIVKPRGQLGSSVFIGLPSLADARIVCQETGVEWPEEAALQWIRPKVQKKSRVTRRLTW